MIISSEVLPDPLGPTMATDSPGAISRSTRLQDLDRAGAAGQRQRDIVEGNDGVGH